MIYKPGRIARSMKEFLVLLEDQLHARGINLHGVMPHRGEYLVKETILGRGPACPGGVAT